MKNFQDFGFELAKNTPLKMKIVHDFGSEKDCVEALESGTVYKEEILFLDQYSRGKYIVSIEIQQTERLTE